MNAGQLNGTFAVWARCNPYPRCQVFRYDIATGSATAPVPAGKIPYAPAVNEYGTAYYMQSDRGCGKSVQLMKQRLTGPPELLSSAAGPDVEVAYAHVITRKQPRELATTRIYYDLPGCAKRSQRDIYRVGDTDRHPSVRGFDVIWSVPPGRVEAILGQSRQIFISARKRRLSAPDTVLSRPGNGDYRAPCVRGLGTSIAPRRRAISRQTL